MLTEELDEIAAGEEVNVLVTGYGPFLDKYPTNASWAIASALPSSLPANAAHPSRIRIHVYPTPLKVSYRTVADLVPELHSSTAPRCDIILHIGMTAKRKFYTFERLAYRGKFDKLKDVDGLVFSPDEEADLFGTCPQELRPTFRCEDVWRRWRSELSDLTVDVRPSDDPGNYLCGFIYYASMAYLWKNGPELERPIMFLHVPDCPTEEDVVRGKEVAIALIRALVDSRRQHWGDERVDGNV